MPRQWRANFTQTESTVLVKNLDITLPQQVVLLVHSSSGPGSIPTSSVMSQSCGTEMMPAMSTFLSIYTNLICLQYVLIILCLAYLMPKLLLVIVYTSTTSICSMFQTSVTLCKKQKLSPDPLQNPSSTINLCPLIFDARHGNKTILTIYPTYAS